MSSRALAYWRGALSDRLDELEQVHASATGAGPGRRWGTEQLNGQLFVALVGQFQAYARSLHDEALDALRRGPPVSRHLAELAGRSRRLDRANPSPQALAEDFFRVGLHLQMEVGLRRHGARRLVRLDRAVMLRNGIAHADATRVQQAAGPPDGDRAVPTLDSYRTHRRALQGLAVDMDAVVRDHLEDFAGSRPW